MPKRVPLQEIQLESKDARSANIESRPSEPIPTPFRVVSKSIRSGQNLYEKLERLLLIILNTLPTTGPNKSKTTKTTMATIASINAYSTRPCPISFGAESIIHLL